MINETLSRKLIALCLVFFILTAYSMVTLAAPGPSQPRPSGSLTVNGEVTVDGARAMSGTTVFPGSTIATASGSGATISLGPLGRIELLPNSSLKLDFNETANLSQLDAGGLRLSTPTGAATSITAGSSVAVADVNQDNVFTVNLSDGNTLVATQVGRVELKSGQQAKAISAGQQGSIGGAAPGTSNALPQGTMRNNLSGGGVAWLLIAIGAAVATAIIIAANNDDDDGNDQIPISPAR